MDNIEFLNLVPKFLDFYKKANIKVLNEEERWTLWENKN